MEPGNKRQQAIALGVCLVALTFLLETSFAHRAAPSPASPYVWSALGTVAALALARLLWLRWRARRGGPDGASRR